MCVCFPGRCGKPSSASLPTNTQLKHTHGTYRTRTCKAFAQPFSRRVPRPFGHVPDGSGETRTHGTGSTVRRLSRSVWKTIIHVTSKRRKKESNLPLSHVTCFRNRLPKPPSSFLQAHVHTMKFSDSTNAVFVHIPHLHFLYRFKVPTGS